MDLQSEYDPTHFYDAKLLVLHINWILIHTSLLTDISILNRFLNKYFMNYNILVRSNTGYIPNILMNILYILNQTLCLDK